MHGCFYAGIWSAHIDFSRDILAKDKVKTKQALKMALGMGKGMVVSILSIVFANWPDPNFAATH